MTKYKAALEFAARGWPVFPLKPDSKEPLTHHGFKDATASAEQIKNWWDQWPDANIGIATGMTSGLAVLDVDVKNGARGKESLKSIAGITPTLMLKTPSGGFHLYYHAPGPLQSRTGILPGIDFKADGGYVVGPGSIINDAVYEWINAGAPIEPLPYAILTLIEKARVNHHSQTAEKDALIPQGRRNSELASLAGSMRHKGLSPESIEAALLKENALRCQPPLTETEVKRIAQSIGRYSPAAIAPTTHISPPWPAPLGENAYYGLAGQFVRILEPHTEADPAALLLQFLTGFGSLINRGPHFTAEGCRHYTNLFIALVGDTSKARKGSSWSHVRDRLNAADDVWVRERIQSGLSSGEGLIWAVRDPIEKQKPIKRKDGITRHETIITDSGVNDKRLLALESELASILRVLAREGNCLSAIVRQAWETGNLRSLTKNSPAKATDAHISIIGHIVKSELLRYLNQTEIANGFANRFLWICTRRSKLLPEGGNLPFDAFEDLDKALRNAIDFSRKFGDEELPRDDAARKLWHVVYANLSDGHPGLFGAVISRAEAQVMRLALLYALLDQSDVICQVHLDAALEVWRYAADSARHIFGEDIGDPLADKILTTLRTHPDGLTLTELNRNAIGHHKGSAPISRALEILQTQGKVKSKTEETGGRFSTRFFAIALTQQQGQNGQKAPPAHPAPLGNPPSSPFCPPPPVQTPPAPSLPDTLEKAMTLIRKVFPKAEIISGQNPNAKSENPTIQPDKKQTIWPQ